MGYRAGNGVLEFPAKEGGLQLLGEREPAGCDMNEQMYIFEKLLQVWKIRLRNVIGGRRGFTVSRRGEMKY